VVNGVPFVAGGPGVFPGGENNIPNPLDAPWQPMPAYVTGGTQDLLQDFLYGNPGAFVRLDGLTPGVEYETRFYNRNWDTQHPFNRTQNVGADINGDTVADDSFTFNADNPVMFIGGPDNTNPTILSYRFTAGAPSVRFSFNQNNPDASFHLYALTNEVATPPPPADTRVPIPTLYSTGVDNNHVPLADGAVDSHYVLTSSADPNYPGPSSFVVPNAWPISPAGPWMGNTATSRWIAPRTEQRNDIDPTQGNFEGPYVTATAFDLTGFVPGTAEIEMHVWSDNQLDNVLLNGTPLGLTAPSHNGPGGQYYIITGPFAPGANSLEFRWQNFPATTNPAGLRVDLVGRAAIVPEPSTLGIAAFAVLGLLAARRRWR
jgi:hypothetical protein